MRYDIIIYIYIFNVQYSLDSESPAIMTGLLGSSNLWILRAASWLPTRY